MEPPRDIYPLIQQIRKAFEEIFAIVKEDESRIRDAYFLLQEERDRFGRDLYDYRATRLPLPYEPLNPVGTTTPECEVGKEATSAIMDRQSGQTPHSLRKTPSLPAVPEGVDKEKDDGEGCDDGSGCDTLQYRLQSMMSPQRDNTAPKALEVGDNAPLAPALWSPKGASKSVSSSHTRVTTASSSDPKSILAKQRVDRSLQISATKSTYGGDYPTPIQPMYVAAQGRLLTQRQSAHPKDTSFNDFKDVRMEKRTDHSTSTHNAMSGLRMSTYPSNFWIFIWPCFGIGSTGGKPLRALVHAHSQYLADVTRTAAESLGCRPAPTVLYEPDGKVVRLLQQLVPDHDYLLFPCGGFYRREAVPLRLLEKLVQSAQDVLYQHIASK